MKDFARSRSHFGSFIIDGNETILGFETPDSKTPDDALAYTEVFLQTWADHPLITPAVA